MIDKIFCSKSKKENGFTIVELMIATIVFSLVMLGAMAALIQVSKLYYKGITNARTQEQSRNVMAEISQEIQFSRQRVTTPSLNTGPSVAVVSPANTEINNTTGFFCIGPKRYTYVIDRKLSLNPDTNADVALRRKESRHVLWVDTPTRGCAGNLSIDRAVMSEEDPCALAARECSNGVELMTENIRLTKLTLSELPSGSDLWTLSIAVAYGDDDLLALTDAGTRYVCEGSRLVSEFCGISELSTTVTRRL